MKRYILSPLASAIIIPGLGQLLNNQFKKGLIILAIIFLLFVGGVVKLTLIVSSLVTNQAMERLDSEIIIQRLEGMEFSLLWVLITLYVVVWLYSILDAFIEGRKIDKERDEKLL